MKLALLISIFLVGCATPKFRFEKSGATEAERNADEGQCKVQAITPFYGSWATFGSPPIYKACMQGKGWQEVQEKPASNPSANN
jgi:hypothetical protein